MHFFSEQADSLPFWLHVRMINNLCMLIMMNASFVSGKFLTEMYLVELPLTLLDSLGTLVEFPTSVRDYVSEI